MHDVVLDSSVVAAWALPDEHLHPRALRVIDRLDAGELEPFVAAPFRFEVRHALVRAARAGRLAWPTVPGWFAAIDGLGSTLIEAPDDEAVILDIATRHGLAWGDAHWVDVAMRLDLPLMTADLRLARAVPDEVAIVVYLGDDVVA